MMNLYREEEKEKRTLSQKFGDFKESVSLNYETSAFNRKKQIKKVTKLVHSLDPKDVATIKEIDNLINRLDLCDPRFGKQLDSDVLSEFIKKINKNGNLKELSDSVSRNLVCYEMGSERGL